MHHGDVTVPKKMTDALQELVTFANQNPNELIIVYISHCDGDGLVRYIVHIVHIVHIIIMFETITCCICHRCRHRVSFGSICASF